MGWLCPWGGPVLKLEGAAWQHGKGTEGAGNLDVSPGSGTYQQCDLGQVDVAFTALISVFVKGV